MIHNALHGNNKIEIRMSAWQQQNIKTFLCSGLAWCASHPHNRGTRSEVEWRSRSQWSGAGHSSFVCCWHELVWNWKRRKIIFCTSEIFFNFFPLCFIQQVIGFYQLKIINLYTLLFCFFIYPASTKSKHCHKDIDKCTKYLIWVGKILTFISNIEYSQIDICNPL